jgi:hypothetical protein
VKEYFQNWGINRRTQNYSQNFILSSRRWVLSSDTHKIILGQAPLQCLKAKTVGKLNSTEMDFWRRSARISRKDKIRNAIITQKMNVARSLLDNIKTKRLQWYGNVQRMEEGRLPKEVTKWSPPGRRKRGRPKLTWAEGIDGRRLE